ncbi:preprotein translocase subunit SecG [Desulfarculales bacterium]
MTAVVIIIHVLACVALVLVVLLQAGKGTSMGTAFGGSSQTVFGSAGATTFLAKMTTVVALVFMLTSLGLVIFSGKGAPPSVMDEATSTPPAQTAPAPAQTAPASVPAPAQDAK